MTSDSQWTLEDDDKDEFDDDGDFFAHFRVKDSDDNSDSESDQDEEDESDHDGAHSGADGSDDNSEYESTQDEEDESDYDGAHPGAEGSDDNSEYESTPDKEDESDHDGTDVGPEDSDGNHGCSGPGDDDDSHTVGNEEIPEEYNNDCGRMFGGDGILCSLSKVRTMDLFAHSGEVQLNLLLLYALLLVKCQQLWLCINELIYIIIRCTRNSGCLDQWLNLDDALLCTMCRCCS